MKKEVQQKDELSPVVEFISKKSLHLLNEASSLETKHVLRKQVIDDFSKKTLFNLKIVKNDAEAIKYEFSAYLKMLNNLIQDLRLTATLDEFEEAKKKCDSWEVESFVTRNELQRMINHELKQGLD